MTTQLYMRSDVKTVASRPVKAKAMQLVYQESRDETLQHLKRIADCLNVTLECAGDQGGLFIHLKIDEYRSPIVSNGDWILVDSFGKVQILKDSEFKIYFEPG